MKFKKWIVENKYGIPQMKIWSKETPIENEENPATCHIDKETSTIEFIMPMLINFLKDIMETILIAFVICLFSFLYYRLEMIFIIVPKVELVIFYITVIFASYKMYIFVKDSNCQSRIIRQMLITEILFVQAFYFLTFIKDEVITMILLKEIFKTIMLIGIICWSLLFLYDVVHTLLAYKKGIKIIINEEKRTNYRFVK